ncbi:MAG TPA: hypothetical protein VN282_05600 [Pyrinomonadaceae bacterium]|nr:hypothetical protein [Pyrinomonadaceae bacterium]
MYNLIVAGQAGAWGGKPYELEKGRAVREHTEAEIIEKYKNLDAAVLSELQSFPALFAYEQGHNADARVGFLKRVGVRSNSVRIEYEFYPDLPPIPAAELAKLTWELDIDKWELNRTHWAVKNVDLLPTLVEAGLMTREQVAQLPEHLIRVDSAGAPSQMLVAPTVFSIPDQPREADLVSVMMPFDASFTPVYDAIRRACEEAGLRCWRADDIWQESAVIQDVFNLLLRSRIVVVDFTGRNPNVMYETGIAHTLGRPVVPISQSYDDVPFDLRHHRVLRYYPNGEGLASMQDKLAERLKTLSG